MGSGVAYVGRLAPSPTGLLHLGHALTFHTAWRRARDAGGELLLLRLDDLDRERCRPHFVDALIEDLAWLGLDWQPPLVAQSARLPLYRAALDQLLAKGDAYACTCSRRELAQALEAPHEADGQAHGQAGRAHDADDEPVYPGTCRPAAREPQAFRAGVSYRMRVPEGEAVRFVDANLGVQSFTPGTTPEAHFGDFLLWRRDGLPSYQLATVVDDAALGVTEVVRGADLLRSTARQLLIFRALALEPPAWFHTRLVLDGRGQRLAKRHNALALRTLRERGLSPAEALALADAARSSD